MKIRTDGGKAFPSKYTVEPGSNKPDGTVAGPNERFTYIETGMTLRDYFAGQALVGVIAHVDRERWAWAAKRAYEMADAMLEARS